MLVLHVVNSVNILLHVHRQQVVLKMANGVQIIRICIIVCQTFAKLISMDSEIALQFCALCRNICDVFGKGCTRY